MQLLFLHYFPGLSLADFETPNGFPVDLWDNGKAMIEHWISRGM